MRYGNFISHASLALFDLPTVKYDQTEHETKGRNPFDLIKKRLLVFDSVPDNDFGAVIRESVYAYSAPDPGFEILFHNDFEDFMSYNSQLPKWKKIKKDYNFFLRSENKRRNTENPYHNQKPEEIETWEELPNFSRQKRNQPWQFDNLYKDAQYLAGAVYELTKDFKEKDDKDLFRAKVNGILLPDKIVYALNSSENVYDFMENELNLANIKLSLDGYKLAYTFLSRTIEALHKIRWNYNDKIAVVDQAITFADRLSEKLRNRITEMERRFILFYEAVGSEAEDDPE